MQYIFKQEIKNQKRIRISKVTIMHNKSIYNKPFSSCKILDNNYRQGI